MVTIPSFWRRLRNPDAGTPGAASSQNGLEPVAGHGAPASGASQNDWPSTDAYPGVPETPVATQQPALPLRRPTAPASTAAGDPLVPATTSCGPVVPAPVAPVDVGGRFSTLPGSMTSTLMDGPGVALDAGSTMGGLIEVRAASLVGDSHVNTGSRRQDAYALRISRERRVVNAVVCDGVGSRSRSNEGAAVLATTVARCAAQGDPDPVQQGTAQLLDMAQAAGVAPAEYSTTMIWVQVEVGEPGEPWGASLVHYGDGDVRFLGRDGLWRPVDNRPAASETSATSFALPLARYPARTTRFAWEPDQLLVLATDGLSVHLDSQTKVGYFLADAWQTPPDRWTFLSQVAFRTVGAGDDRTAVALWRTDSDSLPPGGGRPLRQPEVA